MTQSTSSSSGIYRFLIVIILFSLLYWVLAGKMLGFYNDVESLTLKKSQEDFATSVNHIRTKWMGKKHTELSIKLVMQSDLASSGELKVLVNKNGFITKVISEPIAQCDGLFKNLQSIALSDVKSSAILEQGQVIGCKYTKNQQLLFNYLFLNGIVSKD